MTRKNLLKNIRRGIKKLHLNPGLTLVELIVVISILAVLGTIGIMSVGRYASNARDGARATDIGNITKALELTVIQAGNYPTPDNAKVVTFSGGELWTQGTLGSMALRQMGNMGGGTPVDPKFNAEYTYSLLASTPGTNSKRAYQIAGIMEGAGSIAYEPSIISQAFAAGTESPYETYVKGTYNGMVAKTASGGDCTTVALPSILLSSIPASGRIEDAGASSFVFSGKKNLPSSYAGKVNPDIAFTGSFTFRDYGTEKSSLVLSSTCLAPATPLDVGIFSDKMKSAYDGTELEGDSSYAPVVSTLDSSSRIEIGKTMINTYLGGAVAFTQETPLPGYSCATEPVIAHATNFTTGSPTRFSQAWTYSDTASNCTFACDSGYVWNSATSACVVNECQGDIASLNGIIKPSTTQSAFQTWSYDSVDTDTVCRYICAAGHTYDSGAAKCLPNNCTSSSVTLGTSPNDHSYSVPGISHGNSALVISATKTIPGGTITYSQNFSCSLGAVSQSGGETTNTPSCSANYTVSGNACIDSTPPSITGVAVSGSPCNTVRFTISGANDAIGLHGTPYSFDGGATWQAGNTKDFSTLSQSLAVGQIKVKDAAGNVYTYGSVASGTSSSCAVNCVGSWVNNSTCSATCNGGVLQQRYTITTAAANGGTVCPYADGAIQWGSTSCNTQACPVNCSYGYTQGSCTASCGGGSYYQYLNIYQYPSGGGTACPGSQGQYMGTSGSCNTQSCAPPCNGAGFNVSSIFGYQNCQGGVIPRTDIQYGTEAWSTCCSGVLARRCEVSGYSTLNWMMCQ